MKRVRKNDVKLQDAPVAERGIEGVWVERTEPASKPIDATGPGTLLELNDPLLREPGSVRYWDYAKLLKDPSTTVEQAAAWLHEHRCLSTQHDVTRHRNSFAQVLENARQAAFVSVALVAAARGAGPMKLAEACVVLVEQELLQAVYKRLSEPDHKEMEMKAWRELLAVINLLLGNRFKAQSIRRKTRKKGKPCETTPIRDMTTREIADLFNTVLLPPEKTPPA